MAIDTSDEILQDFLVEAGEILEHLNEQLLDLEQAPDDFNLLNAVFRGFHTIKGGAGFLSIEPLVEVCHRSEDVFNVLRQGQRQVDAELMDVMLTVLDVVNGMFGLVREGQDPQHADSALIQTLNRFAVPVDETSEQSEDEAAVELAAEDEEAVAQIATADASASEEEVHGESANDNSNISATQPAADEITEEEFDALLDELHGKGKHGGVPTKTENTKSSKRAAAKPSADEITEEEFDALLDELHGKGKHGGLPVHASTSEPDTKAAKVPAPDEITEEEFEALLDQLHGKGKHGGVVQQQKESVNATGADNGAHKKAQPGRKSRVKSAPKAAAKSSAKPAAELAPRPLSQDKTAKQVEAQHAPVPKPEPNPETKAAVKIVNQPAAKIQAPVPASAPAKAAPPPETSVRVDTARLDDIMNMVGELVLVRNRLATLKSKLGDEEVANAVGNLDVVTADLQNAVMKTRMQPIKKVFGRFPRVVRDLARSLNKEINLEMKGEDTDLDKNLVEALSDPMVHLVRNAVDHGIETPKERERAGKPRQGTVMLSAAQEGDHILLSISDDGKGMDADVLRKKAVEKGMMDQEAAARLDEKDCYNLIFQPGFSTKTEISDVSGRGVGMDVVKTRIAQMNGTVEIDSELGRGSVITIKLPLTLAILPTLMVVLGVQSFALPLSSVVEIFNLDLRRTHVVDGQLMIMVRERALPLFYLRNWLISRQAAIDPQNHGHVVVVNVGGKQVCLVVDYLIGQEEVVIKPLGSLLQGLEGMAGATITGDGKIALILDIPGLMRKYASRY